MAVFYNGFRDAVHSSIVQQRHLDIISNNLANSSTPGFKRDRLVFNDFMTREVISYHDQGGMKNTDSPLDVAISGEGFFQVRTKDGIRLTRNGEFQMSLNGELLDQSGNPVLGQGGAPINLNPQGPTPVIDAQGGISQGEEQVGRLGIVSVADTKDLEKEGLNYFAKAGGGIPQTTPAGDYTLAQGSLEMSNVMAVREMVGMITAYRSFESYQKAIRAMDEMDGKAAAQVGRVA